MDAVKFLKEKSRMCKIYRDNPYQERDCKGCPYEIDAHTCFMPNTEDDPGKAVELVEKWSKEHPQKTYKDDFLEKFPNAQIDEFKVPRVHWCEVYNDGACRYKSTGGMHLCCDCWNEPMED